MQLLSVNQWDSAMFSQLSEKLNATLEKLQGVGHLSEDDINASMVSIREALIEADVAMPVCEQFIQDVTEKAIGSKITQELKPGEALVKLVFDELVHILGDEKSELKLKAKPPVVIMMVGLQGSGKTTSTAKLAKWLKEREKKQVMVVSTDVYRPAAIEQLAQCAEQVGVQLCPSSSDEKPAAITKKALKAAKDNHCDVLIIDTAGRLHVDDKLMEEIQNIAKISCPQECLLVVDSMAGQDAANVAKHFSKRMSLTGTILTKTDGDARGGAALSMRMITQKPIKFIGTGEKLDGLEEFHPDRLARRILGMGDILSLIEEAERKVDKSVADKMAKKLRKGKRFDFNDFLAQINQLRKMGGMQSIMSKMPGMAKMPQKAAGMMDDKSITKMEAIVFSMTAKERQFPGLINGSRKRRIAQGSGTQVPDVNRMLKQFAQMQKMMKRFKGNKMMNKMKQLQGKIPPEMQDEIDRLS